MKVKSSAQLNMRGVYLHVLGDALGSVIVIISALIIKFASGKWTIYVDPAMSILMVFLILKTSIPLMRESSLILLQTVPTHIKIKEVQDRLLDHVEGVLSVHEFHVWQLAGNKIIGEFWTYNLGENEMEKQTLIPLKSKMKLHKNQNQSVSLDLKWKGAGGGRGSQFSKYMYFVQSTILDWIKWSRKPPSLPWMKPHKSPSVPFSHPLIVEGRQGLNFPSILSKIVGHLISANKRHGCIIDLPKWSKWHKK